MRLTLLAPLKHRDFRLLFIGQTGSMVGNQLYFVALPFQIIALVDRLPRRRVILAMDLLSAVVVAIIAVLGLAHRLEISHLYVLSAFFGATFSFYTPAMSAIMPELVPTDILVPGNVLRGMTSQTARVVGPLIGGLVVATKGPPWAFAIDAATFAFSFAFFLLSSQPRREKPARKPLLAEIREGFAFTFSVTWIWVSIVGFAATNGFFFAGFTVALPILVLNVLHGSAATYGLIGAAGGVGEVAGGLVVGTLHLKRLVLATYAFSALLGLSFAIYGIAPVLPIVLLGAFAFSFCIVGSNTHWDSALQKYVPAKLIGRVTSVDYFGSFMVGPVSPVLAPIALRVGPAQIFVIGGLLTFVYWLTALAVLRPTSTGGEQN